MITQSQFANILEEAYRVGIPQGARLQILREYLQCEVLSILTQLPGSDRLALIGGTGLRLLYDLDRFSEDLDFDYLSRPASAPMDLFLKVRDQLVRREYTVDFRSKRSRADRGGKLVFQNILFDLGISPHKNETLVIKLEYTTPDTAVATETRVLNRFGFVAQVLTEPLPILCARKAVALLGRKRTQPRDIYDLAWFFSHRVQPDVATFREFSPPGAREPIAEIIKKIETISPDMMRRYQEDVRPLLLESSNTRHLASMLPMAQQLLAS